MENTEIFCVLGLGSNRPYGDQSCAELINAAAEALKKNLTELRLSPLYKTAPLYVTDQEPFVNAVVTGIFSAGPRELLKITGELESRYGRDRSAERRWGERSLDIDILLFGGMVVSEADLVIPHPRLKERAFALRPLLDLLPNAVDPETGQKYSDILAALPEQAIEKI